MEDSFSYCIIYEISERVTVLYIVGVRETCGSEWHWNEGYLFPPHTMAYHETMQICIFTLLRLMVMPCFDRMSHKLSVHLWLLYWCLQNKHADGKIFDCTYGSVFFSLTVVRVTVFALILNWTWSPVLLYVLHTKINNAFIQQPVYLVNNLCMFLENTTYQLLFWAINTYSLLAVCCNLDIKLKLNN